MHKTYRFLIGGEWVTSKEKIEIRNPYNQEIVGIVCRPSSEDVETAITSSVKAFENTRKMPSYQRSEILKKAVEKIKERSDELATILCRESGKPIKSARGEVQRAICTLTIASEEILHLESEAIPLDITPAGGDRLGIVRRFPIGPVVGITPFNFPLNLVCHKVGPALATGNTILLKPASPTPISALILGEIIMEAEGLPGSINIIPCSGSMAEKMVTDARLKMISFTGSADVGWELKKRTGKKKICLELGGNAAVIVEPDANLQKVVERSVLGGFAYAGQICISVQRVYIHQKIYDDFVEHFLKKVSELKIGDPISEETDIGPMIDENAALRVENWIEEAVAQGAVILAGGNREGNLMEPTVLGNVLSDTRVACEEAFAPLVILDRYWTFEEAIDKVNDSVYGLQAGVFTMDIEKAFKAYNEIDVGGVIINDIPTYRVDHMPYGGVKDSGFGREGVKYAMEEMTELKVMVVNHGL